MIAQLVYIKGFYAILYDETNDIIIKVGNCDKEINFFKNANHINIIKKINCKINLNKYYIESDNKEWIEKFNKFHYKNTICFPRVYSNIFKHPNNINVCGVQKITNIDPKQCLLIKLSFLFQIIIVTKYLNINLGICHSDQSDRNIWFSETEDKIIDYGDFIINSFGYLLQLGDFGESNNIDDSKCSDLIFVISRIIKQIKIYHLESNESIIYDNDNIFDDFLDIFTYIYKNSNNTINEEDFNLLLNNPIFEPIIL